MCAYISKDRLMYICIYVDLFICVCTSSLQSPPLLRPQMLTKNTTLRHLYMYCVYAHLYLYIYIHIYLCVDVSVHIYIYIDSL